MDYYYCASLYTTPISRSNGNKWSINPRLALLQQPKQQPMYNSCIYPQWALYWPLSTHPRHTSFTPDCLVEPTNFQKKDVNIPSLSHHHNRSSDRTLHSNYTELEYITRWFNRRPTYLQHVLRWLNIGPSQRNTAGMTPQYCHTVSVSPQKIRS